MNNGAMFADLCNYTDYSYFTEHPTVVLETKDMAFAYSVFSVMKVKSDDDWYRFTTVGTEKNYNSRIEHAKEIRIQHRNHTCLRSADINAFNLLWLQSG
jgi:sortase B